MKNVEYVRLYADEQGESHFEDVNVGLSPVDFAPPAAPLNVAVLLPTTESYWIGAEAGWAGKTPHPTPRRQVFCILKGEWEVTVSDGEVRRFSPGSVVLLEDTWGKGHATRLLSDGLILGAAVAES